MKKYFPRLGTLLLFALFISGRAQEPAVVMNNTKINVRGQPALNSEVVTQLQKGDPILILERINLEKAKPGEPTNWARIQMPANTPVWIFASYLKDHKVAVSKANLRAGPGENYSIVGRVAKGKELTEIRTVENWTEVQTPEEAYGFIDASLLKTTGGQAQKITAETVTPAGIATATAFAARPAQPEPPPVITKPAETPSRSLPPPVETPKPQKPANQPRETAVASAPVVSPPVVPSGVSVQPSLPQVAPPITATEAFPAQKRIVRRQGIVRGTLSIQAPTYYELVNPQTKKVMNYLHTEGADIHFKKYRGQRVVVSGEEGIDARWPNTPVIEVESVETAP